MVIFYISTFLFAIFNTAGGAELKNAIRLTTNFEDSTPNQPATQLPNLTVGNSVADPGSVTIVPTPLKASQPVGSVDSWSPAASPILKAIRDFLINARDGVLEDQTTTLPTTTKETTEARTDRILEILEKSFREAATTLKNEAEATQTTTLSSTFSSQEFNEVLEPEAILTKHMGEMVRINLGRPNKRQSALNMVTNVSSSCSSCYADLRSCVQKCFVNHNCHDVERDARQCPPAPTRLCNPFTPWSPIDQCRDHSDCSSPQLCCNDGCVNKCSPGVWKARSRI